MIPKTHIAINLFVCSVLALAYFVVVAVTCILLHISFGVDWKPSYTLLLVFTSFILLYGVCLVQLMQDLYSKGSIPSIKFYAFLSYSMIVIIVSAAVVIAGIIVSSTVQNWMLIECCIVISVAAFVMFAMQCAWVGVVIALYKFPNHTIRFFTSNMKQMYYLHFPWYFQLFVYGLLLSICIISIIIAVYYGLLFTLMNAVLWICTGVVALVLDVILWKPLYVVAKGFGIVFFRRLLNETCDK